MKRQLAIYLVLSMLCLANKTYAQTFAELPNLSYTSDADDTLRQINLVLPEKISGSTPLLLWIGGGAWAYVDRHKEMNICRKFAESGIAVASVGHRLSAQLLRDPKRKEGITHPEHVKDIATAFAWLHKKAGIYGYDPKRIFVGGFSSGAHLSALLATDEQYLQAEGHTLDAIAGIIPVGGAFDIIHYREILTGAVPEYLENHFHPVFGMTDEQLIDASPSTYLENLQTAVLLISDTNTYRYTKRFEDQLKEADYTEFDVIHVGSKSHGELWTDLAQDYSFYRDMIVNFILNKTRT